MGFGFMSPMEPSIGMESQWIARLCFVLLKKKAEFDPTYAQALAK